MISNVRCILILELLKYQELKMLLTVCSDGLLYLTAVIISQYIHMLNRYVVLLKLI